jgi:aminoglycoside phosphotransferase (APT) family kinase protein
MALAAEAGVPCPRLVAVVTRPPLVARILTWIEGEPATVIRGDRARTDRFVASLGTTLRALHGVGPDGFSSRLDGSGPRFASWAAYLDHRLGQVTERCAVIGRPEPALVVRTAAAIRALARQVDREAVPTLCHRDLHLANLLVDPAGDLVGVLDWDGAEAWDATGDAFKLTWLLAPALGVDPAQLEAAERGRSRPPDRWRERTLVVQLIEALNVIASAAANRWDPVFGEAARTHLVELLGRT